MWNLIKRYWDILGGFATGIIISVMANFELGKVQLVYSIIILILVSIGVFKIVKQSIEKNKDKPKKRKKNIIDNMVDSQKPVKAISIATNPTEDGEKLGGLILETIKIWRKKMKKLKVLFDKFKGIILAVALGILTIMEYYGSFINDLFNDKFDIKGHNIIPVIILICAICVGILSNGFTKEQWEKIKALFAKSTTDEIVIVEIKKKLKEDEATLASKNKTLAIKETELENVKAELTNAKNAHNAKTKMFGMVPQLASEEEVQAAANVVVNLEARIVMKNEDIAKIKKEIASLQTTIATLKTQL